MNNKDKIKAIKFNLFDMAICDVVRAIRGGSLVGAFILSLCIIDYLAGIYRKADEGYYKKIVSTYFKKLNPKYDPNYLYAVRCSLVHLYGKSDTLEDANIRFNLQHKNPENHLRIAPCSDGKNIYWLNLSNFVFDIIKVAYIFFEKLENKKEAELAPFIPRAEKIILIRNILNNKIVSKPNFSSIDPIFAVLDSQNIDWGILENDIYKLCLSK